MKVWVTRDRKNGVCWCDIRQSKEKPTRLGDTWKSDGGVFGMTTKEVTNLFGFTPRKGSCKQYNLELTEIEE